jgi:hypothetical protein
VATDEPGSGDGVDARQTNPAAQPDGAAAPDRAEGEPVPSAQQAVLTGNGLRATVRDAYCRVIVRWGIPLGLGFVIIGDTLATIRNSAPVYPFPKILGLSFNGLCFVCFMISIRKSIRGE